jgi:hypothetical protein
MYSISWRSVYPAAIRKLAYVCRHSCSVIGSSIAAVHRCRARSTSLPDVTETALTAPLTLRPAA